MKITDTDIDKAFADLFAAMRDAIRRERVVKKEKLDLGENPGQGFDNTINFLEKDPTFFRLGVTGIAFLESLAEDVKYHCNDKNAFSFLILKSILEGLQKAKTNDPEIIVGIITQQIEYYKKSIKKFEETPSETDG